MSKYINKNVIKFDNIEEAESYANGKYTKVAINLEYIKEKLNKINRKGIDFYSITFNDFINIYINGSNIENDIYKLKCFLSIEDLELDDKNTFVAVIGSMNNNKSEILNRGIINFDNSGHILFTIQETYMINNTIEILNEIKTIEILIICIDKHINPDFVSILFDILHKDD